jgi:hypothetical protein
LFFVLSHVAQAETVLVVDTLKSDTVKITSLKASKIKSIVNKAEQIHDSLTLRPFKPDPLKVVWMGAIIPGYGQIMNKKYWKLPIVYGGFLGCAYAVSWNSTIYESYKTAYRDIIDNDPTTNTFLDILPKGITSIDSPYIGGQASYTSILKNKQDNFRRYRDLSIIVSVAYYALTIVDAYVDAQLYDFDISPDLSLRFQPTLMENNFGARNTFGMQCCLNLK